MFLVHLRKRWNSLFLGEMSYRYLLSLIGLLYHLVCFLVNFLFSWSIHRCEWGIKVSHCYCATVNFPFQLVSICLTYCSAPMLGAYIFIIVISSLILLSLCSVLHLFSQSISKSILSDMSIATPAFFWSPFAWNVFFQPFTFSLYVSLVLRWVSCRQHI